MTLKLHNFAELELLLDPAAFDARLKGNIKRATTRIGLDAERQIKEDITGGKFDKNSPITTAIKGSSRPLVDTGELFKAINSQVLAWDEVVVGVLRSKKVTGKDGKADDLLNIAAVLHEGATITVTQKMRNFFAAMARKHPGKYRPLRASTKAIIIPRRPFLESAVTKAQQDRYRSMWEQAIETTFHGLG